MFFNRTLQLLFVLLLAGACQQLKPGSEARQPEASLRETRWVLHELAGTELPPGPDIYVRLFDEKDAAEGFSGCNHFRATIKVNQGMHELRFATLVATEMDCPRLNTELAFQDVLRAARHYSVRGDTLRIFTSKREPAAKLFALYLH